MEGDASICCLPFDSQSMILKQNKRREKLKHQIELHLKQKKIRFAIFFLDCFPSFFGCCIFILVHSS